MSHLKFSQSLLYIKVLVVAFNLLHFKTYAQFGKIGFAKVKYRERVTTNELQSSIKKQISYQGAFNYLIGAESVRASIFLKDGKKLKTDAFRYNINSRELLYDNKGVDYIASLDKVNKFHIILYDENGEDTERVFVNGGIFQYDSIPLEGVFEVLETGTYRLLMKYQVVKAKPYVCRETIEGEEYKIMRKRKQKSFLYVADNKGNVVPIQENSNQLFRFFGEHKQKAKSYLKNHKCKLPRRRDVQKLIRYMNETSL